MDEVELVLLVVEVRGRLRRASTSALTPKAVDAQLPPHLAEDAVSHLVDRAEGMGHARNLATSNKLPNPV